MLITSAPEDTWEDCIDGLGIATLHQIVSSRTEVVSVPVSVSPAPRSGALL